MHIKDKTGRQILRFKTLCLFDALLLYIGLRETNKHQDLNRILIREGNGR